MSWNYRIDEERRFVITAAWDRLTGSEVIEHGALSGQVKTGQRWSGQNRPTEVAED
jgi:hypothetical protein